MATIITISKDGTVELQVSGEEGECMPLLTKLDLNELTGKLDHLTSITVRAHRAEMANIDAEARALGTQLEEIATGMNAEQATRLRALAARLNALGTPVDEPIPF